MRVGENKKLRWLVDAFITKRACLCPHNDLLKRNALRGNMERFFDFRFRHPPMEPLLRPDFSIWRRLNSPTSSRCYSEITFVPLSRRTL
jgi:hypothetical protein